MNHVLAYTLLLFAALLVPSAAWAQQSNLPAAAQDAEGAVERAVDRFRIGVIGGVAIDPEMIVVGAHGAFGPIFTPSVEFRPGIELGFGELTTMLAINLDVLYTLPGATSQTRWLPYIGAGPTFGFSQSKRSRFITLSHAPRSRARTSPSRRRTRRPPRARGARSSSRRRGRRGCRSTCARPSGGRGPRRSPRRRTSAATPCPCRAGSRRSRWSASRAAFVKTPSSDCRAFAFSARMPPTSTVISGALSVSICARSTSRSSAGSWCPLVRGSCGTRPRSARARRTTPRRSAPATHRCAPA
jgi:hypothetical protein